MRAPMTGRHSRPHEFMLLAPPKAPILPLSTLVPHSTPKALVDNSAFVAEPESNGINSLSVDVNRFGRDLLHSHRRRIHWVEGESDDVGLYE